MAKNKGCFFLISYLLLIMKTIGILFPIKESLDGGVFKGSRSTNEAVRSDLISLLTLRRGQRPMQSRMYSPIYDYIFEQLDSITESELDRKIKEKIKEFIPQINVKKIKFTPKPEENLLSINIIYSIINFFDIEESITIEVQTNF